MPNIYLGHTRLLTPNRIYSKSNHLSTNMNFHFMKRWHWEKLDKLLQLHTKIKHIVSYNTVYKQ